jgi:hypothetical protein
MELKHLAKKTDEIQCRQKKPRTEHSDFAEKKGSVSINQERWETIYADYILRENLQSIRQPFNCKIYPPRTFPVLNVLFPRISCRKISR